MSGGALLAGLALAYGGMLCFCLAMERHWKQLASRAPARWRRACKPLALILLGLALLLCFRVWPPAMAPVAWAGLVSLGAMALVLVLPYAPRLALWLPVAGVLAGALLAAF